MHGMMDEYVNISGWRLSELLKQMKEGVAHCMQTAKIGVGVVFSWIGV